jgi:hypothetical protein
MPEPLPLGSFGTRHYSLLLVAVKATLVCMALPPPFDSITSVGFSLVIVLQIRLLGGIGGSSLLRLLFRLLGWLCLGSLWLWLLTPMQLRNSGLPLLVMLTLFELKAYPRLVTRLSKETRVTADVLMGALSGYVLLGLTAALITALLESIVPGSFSGLVSAATEADPAAMTVSMSIEQVRFIDIAYFSFVTITTLGYGDVLPVTPLAKLSTIFFSVIGPVYLAVIMGVLIGRYLQENNNSQ